MSEIKVNKISPRTACGTTTLGDSGDTFTIPAGVTITNNGTQTGFGREGSVNWQTGSLKTSTFTAANGEGYFINSGSSITVNLPAGSPGAIVAVSDYARNFSTYNLKISANGSEKIGGETEDAILNVDGQAATFVYVDSTKGWINVQNAEDTEVGQAFVAATGGTITTVCTNFKVHTFTGPGTFQVTNATPGSSVDYLVLAGGGGGGSSCAGGGGGAGGYRESRSEPVSGCWAASPLVTPTSLPVSIQSYPITVGGGGPGGNASPTRGPGTDGSNSIFSTITSTGGGGGGGGCTPGRAGGSGGGGSHNFPTPNPGPGNNPPVSPPQGNDGGAKTTCSPSTTDDGGGGGGGAAEAGNADCVGHGGDGVTSSINAAATTRAGGGGGGMRNIPQAQPSDTCPAPGGTGGGGNGGGNSSWPRPVGAAEGTAGTTNTGGGGGGGTLYQSPGSANAQAGGNGGSGIVIIRYRFQ